MAIQSGEIRQFIKKIIPLFIINFYYRKFGVKQIKFEGNYSSWYEAKIHTTGYDADGILAKVLAATLKVKQGEAAYERDSVLFNESEYAWPLLAGLMWAAAQNGGKLNVLDFGGSLGSTYFQNREFLDSLLEVCWNIVEQPHYVEAGQKFIQNEQLRFYKTIEECSNENQPNVILLSSVMQYLEKPYGLLTELGEQKADFIIVDRTPFADGEKDRFVVQRVPKNIWTAILPVRIFAEQNFDRALNRAGYYRVACFPCDEKNIGAIKFRGMLYRRGLL